MANDNTTRKKKPTDADYVILGVVLGILGQAIYDMMRFYYAQYYPHLSEPWDDFLAALFAVIALSGLWRIRLNRNTKKAKQ